MSSEVRSETADKRHPAVVAQHERLDQLRDDIFRLGLERNIVELELYGYTIVDDVAPLSFFDELRETILRLGREDRDRDRTLPLAGPGSNSYLVAQLLARGRVYLWHGAGARTLPGVRVGMTVYFSRMYARTQEPLNELISDEVIERNPPRFAELIGRYNPYPSDRYGFDGTKLARYSVKTNDQRG